MFARLLSSALLLSATTFTLNLCADVLVKDGQTLVFTGDSITARGCQPGGYAALTVEALQKEAGVKAKLVPDGHEGCASGQLSGSARNIIAKSKPDWLFFCAGVNDLGYSPVTEAQLKDKVDAYRKNISELADVANAAGVKLVFLTPTIRNEKLEDEWNKWMEPFRDAVREVAKEKGCLVADAATHVQQALKDTPLKNLKNPFGGRVTYDGIHMNGYGDIAMAEGVLEALGMSKEQIESSVKRWRTQPVSMPLINSDARPRFKISLEEYEALNELAEKDGKTVEVYCIDLIKNAAKQAKEAKAAKEAKQN